jgi:hypothetical protein
LFLTLRPAPYPDPAPGLDTVEVSIEFEPAPGSYASEMSSDNPTRQLTDLSATAFPSLPPGGTDAGPSFDLPVRPTFNPRTPSLRLDALGAMLDCLTVEDMSHEATKHPPRARPPCPYANLPLRAPLAGFELNGSESNRDAFRTGDDYRTFKTIQPMFDESLFPEKVPQANRDLKKWIMGLFH